MTPVERHSHAAGTGPGEISDDGCPVELWATLPAGDIPTLLESALPPGSNILDLGAGAGRLTHPLVAAGHRVTAVDESAEMLSHVRNAETVCSAIENLCLDRRFDAVLLASHLVNVPDPVQRGRLLATCSRHVAAGGVVLIQRYTLQWAQEAGGRTDLGAGISSEVVVRPVPSTRCTLAAVAATYTLRRHQWEQSYVTCLLTDDELRADLDRSGLRLDRWLSDDGRWVVATPG